MWREKIIEAKKALGKSTKTMACEAHLSEKTVQRILTDPQKMPRVDDVLALGATVNLSSRDLFEETASFICSKDVEQQAEETEELKKEILQLKAKIDELKDEIINTHKYYISLKK